MIDYVILTPIEVEFKAVLEHLKFGQSIIQSNPSFAYTIGYFQVGLTKVPIVVVKTQPGLDTLSAMVERVMAILIPKYIFLVGVAGGVKDVTLGDVVVSNKAYNYEFGKEKQGGFVARPQVFNNPNHELLYLAEIIERRNIWQQRIQLPQRTIIPKVYFGPIAAGNKVIATTHSPIYKRLKNIFNDTLALEMEAPGFAKALTHHRSIEYLNIRGISDLLENKAKADKAGYQPIAAAHASAFAFEVIDNLVQRTKYKGFAYHKYLQPLVGIGLAILLTILGLHFFPAVFGITPVKKQENSSLSVESIGTEKEQGDIMPINVSSELLEKNMGKPKKNKEILRKKEIPIPKKKATPIDTMQSLTEKENLLEADIEKLVEQPDTTNKNKIIPSNDEKEPVVSVVPSKPYSHRFYADLNGDFAEETLFFVITSYNNPNFEETINNDSEILLPKGDYKVTLNYRNKVYTKYVTIPNKYGHTMIRISN